MKAWRKKKRILLLAGCLILGLILSLILSRCSGGRGTPVLTVETPQKMARGETFTLDVAISDLGDDLYPAMSMSLRFDPSCVEFLGIEEGNLFVTEPKLGRKLPQWSCNPTQCNESGLINVMYLDLSGGKEAFSRNLLEEEDNVVLRLNFRLRGSARNGDVYDLIFEDAVFAASEESRSLAMAQNTLRVKNAKIVVGDGT